MRRSGVPIAALLLSSCLLAQAQDARPIAQPPAVDATHYGWADVLRVDPVYDDAGPPPASPPREECYDEQTEVAPPPDNRAAGTVLGAIVGGVIGNQFGKGSGRAATTVAGAAAGAAIGNGAAQGPRERAYATERHCRIVDAGGGPRHIVAYDIEYRYRGELYSARMNYDPGDRLRVRVSVTPAE